MRDGASFPFVFSSSFEPKRKGAPPLFRGNLPGGGVLCELLFCFRRSRFARSRPAALSRKKHYLVFVRLLFFLCVFRRFRRVESSRERCVMSCIHALCRAVSRKPALPMPAPPISILLVCVLRSFTCLCCHCCHYCCCRSFSPFLRVDREGESLFVVGRRCS